MYTVYNCYFTWKPKILLAVKSYFCLKCVQQNLDGVKIIGYALHYYEL